MLLRHHARVDLASTDGKLPLHASANDGHVEVSLMLITAGAAIDAVDQEAKMPIHYAAAEGRANVIKLLAEVGGPEGRSSAVQTEFQGCHPMHLAARQSHTAAVRAMIDYFHVDPNQVNEHKHTDRQIQTHTYKYTYTNKYTCRYTNTHTCMKTHSHALVTQLHHKPSLRTHTITHP